GGDRRRPHRHLRQGHGGHRPREGGRRQRLRTGRGARARERPVTATIDPRRPGSHVRLVRPLSCATVRPRSGAWRARRAHRRARRRRAAPLATATASAARAWLGAARDARRSRWAGAAAWTLAVAAHAVL